MWVNCITETTDIVIEAATTEMPDNYLWYLVLAATLGLVKNFQRGDIETALQKDFPTLL